MKIKILVIEKNNQKSDYATFNYAAKPNSHIIAQKRPRHRVFMLLLGVASCLSWLITPAVSGEATDFMGLAAEADSDREVPRIQGPVGEAWDFSDSDNLLIPFSGPALGDSFTIETWLRPNQQTQKEIATIISSDFDRDGYFRLMLLWNETLHFDYHGGGVAALVNLEPGQWYHVVLAFDPMAGASFYVNGQMVQYIPPPIRGGSSYVDGRLDAVQSRDAWRRQVAAIGAYAGGPDHFLHGALGSPRLYQRSLTADEVNGIYWQSNQTYKLIPLPQQITHPNDAAGFALTGNVPIVLADKLLTRDDPVVTMLAEALRQRTNVAPSIIVDSRDQRKAIVIRYDDEVGYGVDPRVADEAYQLEIDHRNITIRAAKPVGAAYAVRTLINLLQNGFTELPAVAIHDWPEHHLRGLLVVNDQQPPLTINSRPNHADGKNMRQIIELAAASRINFLVLRTHCWTFLDDPEVAAAIQGIVDYASRYHVKIMPNLQAYGHAKGFMHKDLRSSHTRTIADEKVVLTGQKPVPLAQRNVIITPHTPILVYGANGQQYEEGRDYQIIEGTLNTLWNHPPRARWGWNRPYISPDNDPFRLQKVPGSRISDGENLRVTYDVAIGGTHGSYCPFSPVTHEISKDSVRRIKDMIDPEYIHTALDEVWTIRGPGRCCQHNHLTPQETLALEMNRFQVVVEEANAAMPHTNQNTRMIIWSDLLDSRQTPTRMGRNTTDKINLTYRDIIMTPWFYSVVSPEARKHLDSPRYFLDHGFSVVGGTGHRQENVLQWGQRMLDAKYGHAIAEEMVLGLIYTTWSSTEDKYSALPTFAQMSWSPRQMRLNAALDLIFQLRQLQLWPTVSPAEARKIVGQLENMDQLRQRIRLNLELTESDFQAMGPERIQVLNDIGIDTHHLVHLARMAAEGAP